jgi:eukaryotic-like serine/threonine-protein kinase
VERDTTNRLGRYEIVGELGKGAMGVVYCARDPMLDRTVAIKTINMEFAHEEMAEYEARFYTEAKAAGGLNHPNIVTIYDIGKNEKIAYMAMELLQGKELKTMIAPGRPLPVTYAVDIAAQIAEGLGYAHEHGIVHRDIKPANIMIVRGGLVKITDFGIARMRTTSVQTEIGIVLGSPRYMSPEQVAGKRSEPRSDTFSLGVILYEMVTGKAPFNGEDVISVMFQILNFIPPPASSMNSEVPSMLDFIVAKALAKAPADRYGSAREMASDLRDCQKRMETAGAAGAAAAPKLTLTSFDPDSAAEVLAQSTPNTRRSDAETTTIEQTAPALGLSKAFDSLDATIRLAAHTGMTTEIKNMSSAMKSGAVRGSHTDLLQAGPGWSVGDRIVFAVSVIGAIVLGALIILA